MSLLCLAALAAGPAQAAVAGGAAPADRELTLAAIHKLENPWNVTRPGPRGELGPYQFRESTWHRHTAEPFCRALDTRLSDVVAERHYEWIRTELERAGIPATTYNIALAWNGGLGAALTGRASPAARNYAQRAVNVVEALAASESVAYSR